jgi:hypothetical protein
MEFTKESIDGLISLFSVGAISFTGTLVGVGLFYGAIELYDRYGCSKKIKSKYNDIKDFIHYHYK